MGRARFLRSQPRRRTPTPLCFLAAALRGAAGGSQGAQVVHHPVDGDGADAEGVQDAAEPHAVLEGAQRCAGRRLQRARAARLHGLRGGSGVRSRG